MSLAVVVGVGVVALVFLLFANTIDKEKHKHIRNFLLLIIFPFLFLIPSTLVLEQTVCEPVVMNETVTGNFTSYSYGEHCFEQSNASRGFLRGMTIVIIVFATYFLLVLGADIIKALKDVTRKI